jgi:hypothetical protein
MNFCLSRLRLAVVATLASSSAVEMNRARITVAVVATLQASRFH